MLKNVSMVTKIVAGFVILLVILCGIAVIGYNSLSNSNDGFSAYRNLARDTNLAGRIQANILKARLNVKDFIATSDDDDIKQVNKWVNTIKEFVKEGEKEILNSKRAAMIVEISKKIIEYDDSFNNVFKLKNECESLTKEILNVKGAEIVKKLEDILLASEKDKDFAIYSDVANAIKNFLLVRLSANKFFKSNYKEDLDSSNVSLLHFKERLDEVGKELKTSEGLRIYSDIVASMEEYKKTFSVISANQLKFMDIIENTLNKLGPEIAD
ncbi:MAG: MCP four helix bundle domain-containing protein, partial [Desulfobacterales bacterium]|nr:MCP four helix bundle domain-containing protein [Desulfobacterales bacterium]